MALFLPTRILFADSGVEPIQFYRHGRAVSSLDADSIGRELCRPNRGCVGLVSCVLLVRELGLDSAVNFDNSNVISATDCIKAQSFFKKLAVSRPIYLEASTTGLRLRNFLGSRAVEASRKRSARVLETYEKTCSF